MQLLLVCLLCCWSWCVSAREIIISENGSDTPSCLEEHNPPVSCQSLVKVSEYVTSHKLNNVTIRINDTNYTLQGVVRFNGVDNITITGIDHSQAHINCNITSLKTPGAGIVFYQSSNITLANFTISNCGVIIVKRRYHNQGTAIQIIDSYKITVSNIMVFRSISQGLTFINTGSTVRVIDSHFINNTVTQSHRLGGGALQVIFTGTKSKDLNSNTNYTIANSVFMYNNATTLSLKQEEIHDSKNYEKGGAIRILLSLNSSIITLVNNTLKGNTAVFGGGIVITVIKNVSNNIINILNNSFINNRVTGNGGGLEIGYNIYKNTLPMSNTINVINSSFIGNIASYGTGGGLSTYAFFIHFAHAGIKHYNQLKCINCLFENNSAQGGAAVSASHRVFPIKYNLYINQIRFTDCEFVNNMVIVDSISNILDGYQNGAFLITEVQVTLAGMTNFTGNNGTALYLDSTKSSGFSTTAEFDANSLAYFSNNSGYEGGAMVLHGNSALKTGDNSSFYFTRNTATKFGGAICALTSRFIYHAPNINRNTCFLKNERQA